MENIKRDLFAQTILVRNTMTPHAEKIDADFNDGQRLGSIHEEDELNLKDVDDAPM